MKTYPKFTYIYNPWMKFFTGKDSHLLADRVPECHF